MKILHNLKDIVLSSLPLVIIMAVVSIFVSPMSSDGIIKFCIGYVCVVLGQALFLVGLDVGILPIGKLVGGSLINLKKPIFIILFGFVFGLLATVAEPALAVFAGQVNAINPSINRTLLVWILSTGIGIAVGFSLFRVIKDINIKVVFFAFYVIVFILAFVTPNQFIAIAFDGSGATTGDVSVPFILALGLGVSTTMSKRKTNEESFGIIGLASVGPIIAVFIYGMVLGNNTNLKQYTAGADSVFLNVLLDNLLNVALALLPIVVVFLIFQFFIIKLPKKQLLRLLAGSLVTYFGLLVFLIGIDFGFSYAAKHIGEAFFSPDKGEWLRWMLLLVAFLLGLAITLSEPAVTVLGEQVQEITNGHIKKMVLRMTLGLGIGFASLLSVLKILLDVNILWFLIPLYAIALILLPFTPKLFVGLAFDSGGVSGGAITSAFLTPLTLGMSQMLGQEILTSGFGIIAFISVTPLIAVQLLGILYKQTQKKQAKTAQEEFLEELHFLQEDALLLSNDGTAVVMNTDIVADTASTEPAVELESDVKEELENGAEVEIENREE